MNLRKGMLLSCILHPLIHLKRQYEPPLRGTTDLAKKPKVGRPKLPKGQAKGRIVPVRFDPESIKAVETAAKAKGQTVSEWIRSTLEAAIHA